jgi:hypothetical protein
MLSRIVQSEIHVICSCNFLKFHVIYVNSCQIMSSMSIQVNSCQFMSTYVNSCHSCHLSLDFSRNSLKWRGRWGGSNMSSLAFGDSFGVRPKAKIVTLNVHGRLLTLSFRAIDSIFRALKANCYTLQKN